MVRGQIGIVPARHSILSAVHRQTFASLLEPAHYGYQRGRYRVLQRKRLAEGLSGRQINAEVGTLRAILRHYGRWRILRGDSECYRSDQMWGRALSREEEARLLEALGQSRSPALLSLLCSQLGRGLAVVRESLASSRQHPH